MRIYVINIDAAPLFDSVRDHLRARQFHQSDLVVNGLFTPASLRSMYAGKVYDAIETDDRLLPDILMERGFQFEIHGMLKTFIRDVLGVADLDNDVLPSGRARLGDVAPDLEGSTYGGALISGQHPVESRFRDWHDEIAYGEFLQHESEWFGEVQAERVPALTHVTWSAYHDFVYYDHHDCDDEAKFAYLHHVEARAVDWLSLFDFDEPDAMFVIFSDHGDYVHRLTPPKDYLRWCFVRDNTADPMVPRPLVAGVDVFGSLLAKIGCPIDDAELPTQRFDAAPDHDRIHHLADTRYWDENRSDVALRLDKLTTHQPIGFHDLNLTMNATAVRAIAWDGEERPSRILQATYYRHTGLYYFLVYQPDHDDPIYRYGFFRRGDPNMTAVDASDGAAGLRAHMIELCDSLVARFDWIENRDYVGQIDRGEFPEWMDQ